MRRSAIAAGAALLLGLTVAAWAGQPPAGTPADPIPVGDRAAGETLATSEAPAPQDPLPLSGNETRPAVKLLAIQVALALTTYDAGEGVHEIAARLPAGNEGQAAAAAAWLHHEGSWSRGRIVYPQLGGILPDSAVVMVVTEQLIGSPDGTRTETRTLDIRVRLDRSGWQFERLASAGGNPVPAPASLPPEALAVLNDPRIELPDSARWDIHAGGVSTALLRLMARLAERTPYGVVTLTSGHPWEIVGTPRMSDHSRGQAVDIYRTGDRPVIDDRAAGSFTRDIAGWLYTQPEVARLGGPWVFEGLAKVSFTNELHQDHLHVAVSGDREVNQ